MEEIRSARAEDAQVLFAIESAVFGRNAWTEEMIRSHMTSPCTVTYLLLSDEDMPEEGRHLHAVAYVAGRTVAGECEIYRVATLPSCRRRGCAKRVLSVCMQDTRRSGCTDYFLEVRESNTAARALYTSLGFTLVGRRKEYYHDPSEDALLYHAMV